MTDERYQELDNNYNIEITDSEFADGWHFCAEYFPMLIGPGMHQMQFCKCPGVNKKLHNEMYKQLPYQGDSEDTEIIINFKSDLDQI